MGLRQNTRWLLLLVAGAVLPGCQGLLLPQPQNTRLQPAARDLRDARTAPVQLPRELALLPKREPDTPAVPVTKPDVRADIAEPGDIVPTAGVEPQPAAERALDANPRVLDERLDRLERLALKSAGTNDALGARLPTTRVSISDKRFYVLGQVRGPGSYDWLGNETVVDAIVQAGFFARMAAKNELILVRPTDPCGGRIVLPICYDDIIELGDTSTNYQILPGDRIIVPKKSLLQIIFPFSSHRPCVCEKSHFGMPIPIVECEPLPCAPAPCPSAQP